jgi:hypothetical protein
MWRADDGRPLALGIPIGTSSNGSRDTEIAELNLSVLTDEDICA